MPHEPSNKHQVSSGGIETWTLPNDANLLKRERNCVFFGRTDKPSFTMSSTRSYLEIQVKFVHSFRVGGGSILNEINYTHVVEDLVRELCWV